MRIYSLAQSVLYLDTLLFGRADFRLQDLLETGETSIGGIPVVHHTELNSKSFKVDDPSHLFPPLLDIARCEVLRVPTISS